jgi:hypothetical protein
MKKNRGEIFPPKKMNKKKWGDFFTPKIPAKKNWGDFFQGTFPGTQVWVFTCHHVASILALHLLFPGAIRRYIYNVSIPINSIQSTRSSQPEISLPVFQNPHN